jgi:hypothetical protein
VDVTEVSWDCFGWDCRIAEAEGQAYFMRCMLPNGNGLAVGAVDPAAQ